MCTRLPHANPKRTPARSRRAGIPDASTLPPSPPSSAIYVRVIEGRLDAQARGLIHGLVGALGQTSVDDAQLPANVR